MLDTGSERVTLGLAETASPGEWILRLRFRGTLNDRMVGFYRSRYDDEGASYVIAATHFEATDARSALFEPVLRGGQALGPALRRLRT